MKNTITVNKKELFKRIEKLSDQLENKRTRELLHKELFYKQDIKNTGRGKDYQIIYKVLCEEYGSSPISQTSIWRLLQIKEKSPSLYNEIINKELSIKAAYNLLTNKKEISKKLTFKRISSETNVEQIKKDLEELTRTLKTNDIRFKNISEKQLRELDNQLFETRKEIGKYFLKKYMNEDET